MLLSRKVSHFEEPVVLTKRTAILTRHARTCSGHPRRAARADVRRFRQWYRVDGRDKHGHDVLRAAGIKNLSFCRLFRDEPDSRASHREGLRSKADKET